MLDEREMQYLYRDGDAFHFMDTDAATSRCTSTSRRSATSVNYLIAGRARSRSSSTASEPVGIELPQTVDLKVDDTAPGIKGATASAQVKPATLETGLVVRCRRSSTRRHDPRQHRDRRVSVEGLRRHDRDDAIRDRAIGVRRTSHSDSTHGRIRISAGLRLDRSHHRQHVQRQERGADPPAAPRADRASARSRSSSRRSTTATATTTSSRTARCGSRRENVGILARAARAGRARHRSRRHRRGAVLRRRAAGGRATRWPTRASA